MSEQICSIKQELADIADLMATTEATITDATDPFPWEVSLDGLRARRLQLTEELATELETELAVYKVAFWEQICEQCGPEAARAVGEQAIQEARNDCAYRDWEQNRKACEEAAEGSDDAPNRE